MRGVIMTDKTQKQPKYKSIPKQVSRKDFNKCAYQIFSLL